MPFIFLEEKNTLGMGRLSNSLRDSMLYPSLSENEMNRLSKLI